MLFPSLPSARRKKYVLSRFNTSLVQPSSPLMANVSCNDVGGREVLAFMDEYNLEVLTELSAAIRSQSEAAMQAKIAEFKDRTYRNRITVEGFEGAAEFAVCVDVRGHGVEIDFDGTSGCARAGVNVPFCYTVAVGDSGVDAMASAFADSVKVQMIMARHYAIRVPCFYSVVQGPMPATSAACGAICSCNPQDCGSALLWKHLRWPGS